MTFKRQGVFRWEFLLDGLKLKVALKTIVCSAMMRSYAVVMVRECLLRLMARALSDGTNKLPVSANGSVWGISTHTHTT